MNAAEHTPADHATRLAFGAAWSVGTIGKCLHFAYRIKRGQRAVKVQSSIPASEET